MVRYPVLLYFVPALVLHRQGACVDWVEKEYEVSEGWMRYTTIQRGIGEGGGAGGKHEEEI